MAGRRDWTMADNGGNSLQRALAADAAQFRFRAELSLEPLIRFWMNDCCGAEGSLGLRMTGLIREQLEQAPELSQPITDPSILEKHSHLIDVLMSAVFPMAAWEYDYC